MSVDGPEERPLLLADLAQIDSPEVVRSALKRFRRRFAVRALWVLGLVAAIAISVPSIGPSDLKARFRESRAEAVGADILRESVRVTVMTADRIDDETVGVHLIAVSDDLFAGEHLYAWPSGAHGDDPRARGLDSIVDPNKYEFRGAGHVVEGWIIFDVGTAGFSLDFLPGRGVGPGGGVVADPAVTHGKPGDRQLCDGPPDPDDCGFFRERVDIDMRTLGVSDAIWR